MLRLLTVISLASLAACADPDCPEGTKLNESKSRCIPVDAGTDASMSERDGGTEDAGARDGGVDASEPADAGIDSGPACLGYTDAGACICEWRDGSRCPDGTWCHPDLMGDRGTCVEPGLLPEDAVCGDAFSPVCREGLVCMSLTDASPVCRKVCDPDEAPATTCEPQLYCDSFYISGEGEAGFGVCDVGCDYDEDVACEDPARICVAAEVLGLGEDVCMGGTELAPGADCEEMGLTDAHVCGGLKGCVRQPDDSIRCTEFCRPSKGDYGVAGHPDCSDAGDVCTEYRDWGVGTCG